ncbi:hypothetical protein XELAEV_18027629mg [Xenopus laevis]|uniref:Reverse transcriptase domain-containing protein n=1 Tax=Xenopus laevis TaxID=8355 RepID=A0A974CY23_XENLA|nr:hypothetical protein XELAEV_18027629mg [Xenopus laevis]
MILEYKEEIDTYVYDSFMEGFIDKNAKDYLTNDFPMTPILYMLPKIHKNFHNPPGRPIIFLLKLEKMTDIDTCTHLCTFDIQSLYTCIPHSEGIMYVEEALYQYGFSSYIKKYFRYVDDVFFTWHGCETELLKMSETLNTLHPTLKFTFEYHPDTTHFLDVTVIKNENTLKSDLLQFTTIQVKRIVLNDNLCNTRMNKMAQSFIERGYSRSLVETQKKSANRLKREDLLTNKIPKKKDNGEFGKLFKETPLLSYRRSRNIGDTLTKADLLQPITRQPTFPSVGTSLCLSCGCCNGIIKGENVIHPSKGYNIKLQHFATCTTTGVIYMLKCPCGKAYEVRTRIGEHKRSITNCDLEK